MENISYTNMSDDDKIRNNQKFFAELEQKYGRAEKQDVIGGLNQILASGAKLEDIKDYLLNPSNKKIGNLYNDYIECLRILEIAEVEEFLGLENFYKHIDCVEEAVKVIQKLRFYLRRIEFGWEEDEWKEILNLIEEYRVSFVFLCKLCLEKKVRRPKYIIEQIAKMYEEIGKSSESVLIVSLYNNLIGEKK